MYHIHEYYIIIDESLYMKDEKNNVIKTILNNIHKKKQQCENKIINVSIIFCNTQHIIKLERINITNITDAQIKQIMDSYKPYKHNYNNILLNTVENTLKKISDGKHDPVFPYDDCEVLVITCEQNEHVEKYSKTNIENKLKIYENNYDINLKFKNINENKNSIKTNAIIKQPICNTNTNTNTNTSTNTNTNTNIKLEKNIQYEILNNCFVMNSEHNKKNDDNLLPYPLTRPYSTDDPNIIFEEKDDYRVAFSTSCEKKDLSTFNAILQQSLLNIDYLSKPSLTRISSLYCEMPLVQIGV
jgi:hypothetical protein